MPVSLSSATAPTCPPWCENDHASPAERDHLFDAVDTPWGSVTIRQVDGGSAEVVLPVGIAQMGMTAERARSVASALIHSASIVDWANGGSR